MKTTSFSVERLLSLFKKQKVATMSELKKALGSDCSMTVFRKLRELGYITSCSHSGKFYSLNRFARFDHMGLWFFNSVLFSYYGTLGATLKALIEKSDNGYTAAELERILSVKPNGPLIDLIGKKRIRREKISGVYVYFSKNTNVKKQQELIRKESMSRLEDIRFAIDLPLHEIKAAIILFYSILNEKQRRLYAGLESLRVGHGGDRLISELLALNEKTVSKGRKELLEREVVIDSIRRKGGGRKTIKKIPEVIGKIEELMKDETAGDPISGLLWTRKTRDKISGELAEIGIRVCATTVGDILKKLNYSLKCNSKKVSNGGRKLTKAEEKIRDEQFKYIAKIRSEFMGKGLPSISVDTKKKELIGNFKNPGTRYKKESDLVNDHDFIKYAKGKVFPYGLFDMLRYEGFVYVGQSLWDEKEKCFTSRETAEFAAESIARYWKDYGIKRYGDCNEMLILADAGGSNGYRSRMWKFKIYEQLATKFGMHVTVCHYPPGASKWNPVEHKLFSEISKNWKGTPLRTFETVLNYIRTTKTKTGLTVKARSVKKIYKTGKSVSNDVFKDITIRQHEVFPDWNYTISPDV